MLLRQIVEHSAGQEAELRSSEGHGERPEPALALPRCSGCAASTSALAANLLSHFAAAARGQLRLGRGRSQ